MINNQELSSRHAELQSVSEKRILFVSKIIKSNLVTLDFIQL